MKPRARRAVTIPNPPRDTRARRAAREALAALLWDDDGHRRLPRERELVAAMERCGEKDLWWVCETNSAGPLYHLPTREWMRALAGVVRSLGVRKVVEVAAGDGFVAEHLARLLPDVAVIATDSGKWSSPRARMSADDEREFRDVPLAGITARPVVEKIAAVRAVKLHRPDLVLVVWPPPGTIVDRVIRAPTKLVLDISVDGDVCGNGTRTWRFEKEFLSGAIEERGLCRLDGNPSSFRHTRATLYYGARHRRFAVERRRTSRVANANANAKAIAM